MGALWAIRLTWAERAARFGLVRATVSVAEMSTCETKGLAMATPPPPPPPLGPPSGMQYPPQPYGPVPQNGMGVASLVLGIVGLALLCAYGFGFILSILAIVFGKIGLNRVDQGLANNRSVAKAGFVLGIIGTALAAVALVVIVIVVLAGVASNGV